MSLMDAFSSPADGWRRKLARSEWGLYIAFAMIACFGAVMLYGAAGGSWQPWAANHLVRFVLCGILMALVSVLDVRIWYSAAYPAWLVTLLLLVAVELVGHTALGAQRWLNIGPIRVQPSEFAKISVAMAVARYYHDLGEGDYAHIKHHLIPIALTTLPTVLIMHQPDLGTSLMVAGVGFGLTFLAGLSWWIISGAALTAAIGGYVGFQFFMSNFQKERIYNFLDPSRDPLGTGYHITQSKIAIGSGGLFGVGFMKGTQSQLDFLPERHTDFIMAMLLEEFGLLGGLFVLGLYLTALILGLRIALSCGHRFGRFLAGGLSILLFIYVSVNAGMTMGLLPVVGVPMAVLSHGGSVMISVMFAMGLVENMRIHRDQNLGNRFAKRR